MTERGKFILHQKNPTDIWCHAYVEILQESGDNKSLQPFLAEGDDTRVLKKALNMLQIVGIIEFERRTLPIEYELYRLNGISLQLTETRHSEPWGGASQKHKFKRIRGPGRYSGKGM